MMPSGAAQPVAGAFLDGSAMKHSSRFGLFPDRFRPLGRHATAFDALVHALGFRSHVEIAAVLYDRSGVWVSAHTARSWRVGGRNGCGKGLRRAPRWALDALLVEVRARREASEASERLAECRLSDGGR